MHVASPSFVSTPVPARTSVAFDRTALSARGVGELRAVESLPDAVVAAFSALTYLGDPWLCLFAVALAYVVGDRAGIPRPAAAFVLALGLGAVGVTVGLKGLFALPRPPGAAETGYGFPSGHALGSTVFWGGAALLAEAGRRRTRVGVAAAVVAVIAVSRVVVGVHYLADAVVGVAVGAAFLAVVVAAGPGLRRTAVPSRRTVVACFLLAGALCAVAALLDPSETVAFLGAGTAVGSAATWWRFGEDAAGATVSSRSLAVGALAFPLPLALMVGVAELAYGALVVAGAGAAGGSALLWVPVAAAALSE